LATDLQNFGVYYSRVARWFIAILKISISENFGGPWNENVGIFLEYFTDIWYNV
jgi:hypothetical protein